jgi:hypothetical protein
MMNCDCSDSYQILQARRITELIFLGGALALLLVLATLHLAYVGNDAASSCLSNAVLSARGVQRHSDDLAQSLWDPAQLSAIHLYGWTNCSNTDISVRGLKKSFFCTQGWEFLEPISNHKLPRDASPEVPWMLDSQISATHAINEALPKMFAAFSERVGDSYSDSSTTAGVSITASLEEIRAELASIATASFEELLLRARSGDSRPRALRAILSECAVVNEACNNLSKRIERLSYDFASNALELFSSDRVYLFSQEKGYLMLSGQRRKEHGIRSELIEVPVTSPCFSVTGGIKIEMDGETFSLPRLLSDVLAPPADWLIHHLIGYDIILSNWISRTSKGDGYLLNTYSKNLFDLSRGGDGQGTRPNRDVCPSNSHPNGASASAPAWARNSRFITAVQSLLGERFFREIHCYPSTGRNTAMKWLWQKAVVIGSTVFLYFTTSTLVSFTLKETQERMLRFTYLLQYYTRHHFSILKLVTTHMVESLVFVPIMVGIMGFLFEFLGDSLLTFLVLSLVWICEVYTVVTVRTMQSAVFFPRFSFMLFCGLYFYVFSYPFGFAYLALATVSSFMCYIMLHLWNTYELPALLSGDINPLNVRMLYNGGILSSASTLSYNTAAAIPMPPDGLLPGEEGSHDGVRGNQVQNEEEPDGSALAQIHRSARKASPAIRAPSTKAKKSNVRHAGNSAGSSVNAPSGEPLTAFPPLPSRKAPMRSSLRTSSKDTPPPYSVGSNDDADLGLSLDDDHTNSPYEAQIALSRRIQAQEMQEAVTKLLRSSSSRLNLLHMTNSGASASSSSAAPSPSGRLSSDKRVASVDDFGYKKSEFSIFGDNSQN